MNKEQFKANRAKAIKDVIDSATSAMSSAGVAESIVIGALAISQATAINNAIYNEGLMSNKDKAPIKTNQLTE